MNINLNASFSAKKIYISFIKNNINNDTAVEMLLSLIEASDSVEIRIECIEVFGKIANKSLKVFKILENYLLSDESPLVKAAAAKPIINNYPKIGFNSLLWTIEHENSSIILKTLYEAFENSNKKDFDILFNKLDEKYGIVSETLISMNKEQTKTREELTRAVDSLNTLVNSVNILIKEHIEKEK